MLGQMRDTLNMAGCLSMTHNLIQRLTYGHVKDLLYAGLLLAKYGIPNCYTRCSQKGALLLFCLSVLVNEAIRTNLLSFGVSEEEANTTGSGFFAFCMFGAGMIANRFHEEEREEELEEQNRPGITGPWAEIRSDY